MANATEKKESTRFSERLINFLQKYRLVLLICVGTVIAVFIALSVTFAIVDSSTEKNIAAVESFAERYDTLKAEEDEAKRIEGVSALIAELEGFVKSRSRYEAARGYSILAGIRADKKDWAEAEAAWLSAADALPKSYLAPAAVYNAATAAEELGDGTRALELYSRCADAYGATFSQAPRAYLAIGRLNEERKDFASATAAYKKIIESWPNDSWARLAHGRLLAISFQEAK